MRVIVRCSRHVRGFSSTARQLRSSNGAGMSFPASFNDDVVTLPPVARPVPQRPAPASQASVASPRPGQCDLDSELWHACAGPLASLPPVNSRVTYWPQGHIEQADADTDEVFAQMTLTPESESDATLDCEEPPPPVKRNLHMFCKTLTASDTSTHGGFSVPRRAAEACLPTLDMTMNPPCQELMAKDLHGVEWKFRHIYRGHPRRHLLTTGWSVFVSTKRLVAGDSVIFLRGENGQLRLGVRRATKQLNTRNSFFTSQSMHLGVLAAASHAAREKLRFNVIYNPRTSPAEFVIPYHKYKKALTSTLAVGTRFKMRFETEDTSERRYAGTVTSTGDLDPERWPKSLWRSLKVGWDESAASERHERVSPWEIEPFVAAAAAPPPPPAGPKLKRRSTLGANPSCQGSSQASKLARILQQGMDPRIMMSAGEEEEAVSSSVASGWGIKREDGFSNEVVAGRRMGAESWTPMWRPEIGLPEMYRGLPGMAGNRGILTMDSSQQNLERQQQQLRLCVQKMREQQESAQLANALQMSSCQLLSDSDLSLSMNSTCSKYGNRMQWLAPALPVCESPGSSSLTWSMRSPSPAEGLPSRPTAGVSEVSLYTDEQQHKLKIFGFDLTEKPIMAEDLGLGASPVVSEHTGSPKCNAGGGSGSGSQGVSEWTSKGGAKSWAQRPLRSYTKVYKQGMPGRSIDLSKFGNYSELRHALAAMFQLEGQLDDPLMGWQVVYTDHEDDVLLVGDDPWVDFCSYVRSLKILSPAEAVGKDTFKKAHSCSSDEVARETKDSVCIA